MRVLRGGCLGFFIGAITGGLLLAGPTFGNHEFAHETNQNSLSMFVIGAVPGSVLGLLIGLIMGAVRARQK